MVDQLNMEKKKNTGLRSDFPTGNSLNCQFPLVFLCFSHFTSHLIIVYSYIFCIAYISVMKTHSAWHGNGYDNDDTFGLVGLGIDLLCCCCCYCQYMADIFGES